MNRCATLTITPVLLLTLVGCASSPSRTDNTVAPGSVAAAVEHEPEAQPSVVAKRASDQELVLGESFDEPLVPSYTHPMPQLSLEEIRTELESMYEQDRELVAASYQDEQDRETLRAVQAIDRAHADRLEEIVDHIGWPTRDLVGLKATQAAYMVIQHAGHNVEFQNRCLEMMVDLVAQGKLPASYVALLTDRIRVFSDQPQVFGTQMCMARNTLGVMVPTPTVPIEDPDHLDDRRALMGMVKHERFVEAIQLAYNASMTEPNSAFAAAHADPE